MEEQQLEFRVLLVQISEQLSSVSREALHFIFGPIIPRQCRDDCTPSGTLQLLEFLFERGLISERRFDYLIRAFLHIGCGDVVDRLKGSSCLSAQRKFLK